MSAEKNFISRVRCLCPWLAAVVSGALLALCYAPVRMGALAWVALVPLVEAVWFSRPAVRFEWFRAAALGFVAGLVYFTGSLAWFSTVTGGGWIVAGIYLAIYPALWAVFVSQVARPFALGHNGLWTNSWRNLGAAIISAAAWVALEWLRSYAFTGFGWNSLGVALCENLAIIQIAEVTGVAGISFLLVMVNVVTAVTLVRLVQEIRARRMKAHWDFSLTVVTVALVFGYGVRCLYRPAVESQEIKIAAIQAAFPIGHGRTAEQDSEMLDTLDLLSQTALAMKPDLLVWPEAAPPRPFFLDEPSIKTVRSILENFDGTFLSGIVHYTEHGDFNSAVMLTRENSTVETAQFYHKMHLVPFGEYVPLRESFPPFQWLAGDIIPEDFDAGKESTVLKMKNGIRVGALICFEDTLPNISRDFANGGAQFLVNLTNDAWFLRSAASQQQRDNAVFRAIETRLPLLRVANTGVTCLIDSDGRQTHILQTLEGDTFAQGVLIGIVKIPLAPEPTFFTRYGEIFSLLCTVLALLAFVRKLYCSPFRSCYFSNAQ